MNSLDIPSIQPWLAGDTVDENMMNEIQDALEFIMEPPECRLKKITNQSITTSTWTPVAFDNLVKDKCAPFDAPMWSSSVNPERITIQVPGWYDVFYATQWDTATDEKGRIQALRTNVGGTSTNEVGRHDKWHQNERAYTLLEYPVFFNKDDYVELMVWHDKGRSTSILADTTSKRYSTLHVKWVSL